MFQKLNNKNLNSLVVFFPQVSDAVDLSVLLQCLQEERAAVAMSIFLKRPVNSDNIDDLQHYVTNGADITRFTLTKVNLTRLFKVGHDLLDTPFQIHLNIENFSVQESRG